MLKLILALTLAAQVVASSQDAGELALWLPGLVIGCMGLALGDRRHFNTNDLFFILFLFLFVVAPADQIDGLRFQGDISVRGIVFPDHVLARSVVLADLFGLCVVIVKLFALLRSAGLMPLLARLPRLPRLPLPAMPLLAAAQPAPQAMQLAMPAMLRVDSLDSEVVVLEFEPVDPHLVVLADWPEEEDLPDEEYALEEDEPLAMESTGAVIAVEGRDGDEAQGGDEAQSEQVAQAEDGPASEADAQAAAAEVGDPDSPLFHQPPPSAEHEHPAPARHRPVAGVGWLLAAFAAIDCALVGGMVAKLGFGFITDGRDYTLQLFAGNPALAVVAQAVLQIVPLIGLIVAILNWQRRGGGGALFWLVTLGGLCLLFDNPLNTARFQFGAYVLMVALFAMRGRIPQAVCQVSLIAYLLVIMPVMSALRHGGATALANLDGLSFGVDFKQLDYDAFSMFTCAVYRTGDNAFAGGSYLLSVLLFFVPRGLWPDKPQSSSVDLGQFLMQHHSGWFDNLSCPPFGDFYMDFGTFGVIAGGLLYGVMLAWSDRVISAWNGRSLFHCGIAAAVIGYLPILVRGSLGAVVGGFVVTVLLFLLVSRAMPATAPLVPATTR